MRTLALLLSILALNCTWEGKCFPVPFTISLDNSDYPIETIERAVEYWNENTGQEVFLIDGPGQINILEYEEIIYGEDEYIIGQAFLEVKRNKIRGCQIRIKAGLEEFGVEVLAHELGHCLGLSHSDPENSLMLSYGPTNMLLLDEHYSHIENCSNR